MLGSMTNREIVESFYEAVGEKAVIGEDGLKRGDIDHFRRIFAMDIEWIHPALGGAYHGADSVINEILITFFDNWELESTLTGILKREIRSLFWLLMVGSISRQGSHSLSLQRMYGT